MRKIIIIFYTYTFLFPKFSFGETKIWSNIGNLLGSNPDL